MMIATIEKNALGACHPFLVKSPTGVSTPNQLKKLKTRSNTPETAVVISPGVSFLRSKTYPLFRALRTRIGHIGN